MRVGIDGRKEWDGGIGRYIRNLFSGLENTGEITELHAWLKPDSGMLHRRSERFYPHVERAGLYSIREQISLSRKVKRTDIDLYHEPHYIVPFSLRVPLVVTIHDIIHIVFPKSVLHKRYATLQMRYAVKHASAVITPSRFTRSELIRHFPEASGKTFTVLYGIETSFSPKLSIADDMIRKEIDLPERYLFYVGNHKPHKNITQLLEICREIFRKDPSLFLCITGNEGDENGAVHHAAVQLGIESQVKFLGNLDSESLQVCYRHAQIFVFPSLYEGFGFPPLEAMACGTPVVAFNVASIPEVVGDAGVLVPARDGKSFYEAIISILKDPESRRWWGAKGVSQARKFQWKRSISEHLSIYHKALSKPLV